MIDEKREELKKEIQSEETIDILKDILVELRVLNLFIASSQKRSSDRATKTKEEIEKIRSALPPEAQKLYDTISKGLIK